MFRHCFLIFWLMAVSMLWCSTGVFGKIELNPHGFPADRTETYSDPGNRTRIYRVQEPEERRDHPNILIYMHGSAGKEEQGMDLLWERGSFARLRNLMNRWGWVYVCPRDAEFAGLLKHLKDKYAPEGIYLAGASGGGNIVLWEAGRNPSAYAGLLLLCPAIQRGKKSYPNTLSMPVWIVSGAKDRKITRQCRALVKQLRALQSSYFYREIPGGHHGTPVEKVAWQQALEFLQGNRREVVASLPTVPDALGAMHLLQGRQAELKAKPVP
ncbi:hypothetical protein A7E78_09905 [Syntrophotalea acetylenivorans]|uniref:Alpha/beta hydrolase n=1 Tax=Syntrophotalea acetylenivorans TaxID=1842532 RepID=A0A1L3GR57_9BACT|nr:hypothetical protein [Syntrophotalea acetylenivorans]APG28128.1 hypothetical protein A7E78_09905 [Syntrophotalea acetylenivorans]